MSKNTVSKHAKHIDTKYHFLRDHVNSGKVIIKPISTKNKLLIFLTIRNLLNWSNREGELFFLI